MKITCSKIFYLGKTLLVVSNAISIGNPFNKFKKLTASITFTKYNCFL